VNFGKTIGTIGQMERLALTSTLRLGSLFTMNNLVDGHETRASKSFLVPWLSF
jgi:hypothetical protein